MGYEVDPRGYLERTFEQVGGYDQLVVLRDIRFVSFCEHHMLPVVGRAHVGYLPTDRVVGISKLARVVNGFARRLQIQEKLTAEIGHAIQDVLQPLGVGVVIEAEHSCMTLRGVNTPRRQPHHQPPSRRDPRRPKDARGVPAADAGVALAMSWTPFGMLSDCSHPHTVIPAEAPGPKSSSASGSRISAGALSRMTEFGSITAISTSLRNSGKDEINGDVSCDQSCIHHKAWAIPRLVFMVYH